MIMRHQLEGSRAITRASLSFQEYSAGIQRLAQTAFSFSNSLSFKAPVIR
jgi:hypothetical protein